jgi:hypothetical protein
MTECQWLAEAVTEEEWLGCRSMEGMPKNLDYCFGRCGVLFAAACCRSVRHLLPDEPGRAAVLAAERYADGNAAREELEAAEQRASEAGEAMFESMPGLAWKASPVRHAMWTAASLTGATAGRRPLSGAAYHARQALAWEKAAAPQRRAEREGMMKEEAIRQWALVLDIFGNPHRPVALAPARLAPTIVSLALAAWDHRVAPDPSRPGWLVLGPARLAILADAVEEAGCDEPEILEHLRGPIEHVRGCWCVDAILARE